jgi:hypothetical protein
VAAWLVSVVAAVFMHLGPRSRSGPRHDPGHATAVVGVDATDPRLDHAVTNARLARAPEPSGGERLQGETTLRWTSDTFTRVTEDVHLDRAGRLVRAEIEVDTTGDDTLGGPPERLSIDASRGIVLSVTRAGRTGRQEMPTDLPWAYLPVEAPGGVATSTPAAAIVAEHAARAREAVWLVDARGHGAAMMSDQILVPAVAESRAGAHGDCWLVLGDDLATFGTDSAGRSKLLGLRVAALGTEMTPHVTTRGAP